MALKARNKVELVIDAAVEGLNEITSLVTQLDGLGKEGEEAAADLKRLTRELTEISNQQKLITQFREQKNAVRDLGAAYRQAQRQSADLAQSLSGIVTPTKQQVAEFEKAKAASQNLKAAYVESQQSLRQLRSELKSAGVVVSSLAASQARLATQSKAATQAVKELSTSTQRLASAKPVGDITRAMREGAERTGKAITQIRNLLGLIGVTAGLAQVVQAFTQAAKTGETFARSLNIIADSTEEAAVQQQRLLDISQKYGLEVTGLERAFVNFQAAVAGTNFEGERGNEIFESFAGSMGLLGKSSADIEGALLAVNQIINKNTVSAEELRLQLAERLPGAMRLSAEALDLTTAELSKQLELGNIMAEDLLPKLAKRLNDAYGLDTVQKVEGLSAAQNRLSTATTNLFRAFANSGAATAFADTMDGLANVLVDVTQAIEGTSDGVFGLADEVKKAAPDLTLLGESAATSAEQIDQVKTSADAATTSIVALREAQSQQAEIAALEQDYIETQRRINEQLQRRVELESQLANTTDPLELQEIQTWLEITQNRLKGYADQLDETGRALREKLNPELKSQREKLERQQAAIDNLTASQKFNIAQLEQWLAVGKITTAQYERMRQAIIGTVEAQKQVVEIGDKQFKVTQQQAEALEQAAGQLEQYEAQLRAAGRTEQEIADAKARFTQALQKQAEVYSQIKESSDKATDGAKKQAAATSDAADSQERVTKATKETAEASERTGGTVKIASDYLREMAARAENARDSIVEGGREGSEAYQLLDAQIQSLRDNLEIIDKFSRSPRSFATNFSYGFGELLRNAEAAKAAIGNVDEVMQRLGDNTTRAGDLSRALQRGIALARNEAEILGEQRLQALRTSIADAERRMQDFAERVADARRELERLDAREARAQGDEEKARLLEQELAFAEELAQLEARIAEARRLGLLEEAALLEKQKQRLLDIQRIERQRLEDEAKARKEREREEARKGKEQSQRPPAQNGGGSGASGRPPTVFNFNALSADQNSFRQFAQMMKQEIDRLNRLAS